MHSLFASLALLSFLPFSVASRSSPSDHVVLERRQTLSGWAKASRLQSRTIVPVRIGLSGTKLDRGHEYLMDVSDSSSSNYGKHWTFKEVTDMFAPSEETLDATMTWLHDAGISSHRITKAKSRGFLNFDATISELENLLKTEYYLYEHMVSEKSIVACDQYHVPLHLANHVDFISPGVGSTSLSHAEKRSNRLAKRQSSLSCLPPPTTSNFSLQDCSNGIFPQCINALYGIPKTSVLVDSNTIGIFEANATYLQSDMDLFFKQVSHGQIPVGTTAENILLNGVQLTTNVTPTNIDLVGESNLDFQLAWPLVYPHNITMYSALPNLVQIEGILNPT